MAMLLVCLERIRPSIMCEYLDNSLINNFLEKKKKKELGRTKLLCFYITINKTFDNAMIPCICHGHKVWIYNWYVFMNHSDSRSTRHLFQDSIFEASE